MPLAAYLPEAPHRDLSNPIADAIAQRPELRALRADDLARATGTSRAAAVTALAIITQRTTGALDHSGRSLDERFARYGQSAPAATWDDAGALAPRAFRVWAPRTHFRDAAGVLNDRYLKSVLPLGFVYDLGQRQTWPADPSNPNEPHPATLDTLALFAYPVPVYGTTGYGTDVPWNGLQPAVQANLRQLWRDQLAGRTLPTDSEGDNPAIQWPDSGDTLERKIYFWDIEGSDSEITSGRGRVLQRMQLQKWSNKDQQWRVWNQWGQDLLFTRKGAADRWEAGWDLGTWFRQNEAAFGQMMLRAMQSIALGVATVFSAGTAAPLVAAGIAAWEATVQGLNALAHGDVNGAIANLTKAAQGFGTLAGKSEEGKKWGEALDKWIKTNAPVVQNLAADAKSSFSVFVKTFDKIKGQLNALNLPLLREGAKLVGVQIPKIDPIADVKKALDDAGPVRAFLERGYREVTAPNIPDDIPWYARAAYMQGQTYRAAVDAQRLGAGSFIGGTILRPTMQRTDLAKLQAAQAYQATADELCRSADVMRKANRPVEADLLQKQCDAARAKAAATRAAAGGQTAGGGAIVPIAAGAGLLWLLLKGAAL